MDPFPEQLRPGNDDDFLASGCSKSERSSVVSRLHGPARLVRTAFRHRPKSFSHRPNDFAGARLNTGRLQLISDSRDGYPSCAPRGPAGAGAPAVVVGT